MSAATSDTNNNVDIDALLDKLTLDEQISLLAGASTWETAAIDRLDVPSLKVTDGPNGARGETFLDGTTAACFPSCVSLAATFNRTLSRRVGKALGQESQTKGAYVLLGPTVCSHRSPLGGRNFEAFSEDPLLSGLLAAEYVKGLQSERVGATVKHYLANEQDTRRFSINETISERALREMYLRPFEIVVKSSAPWCVMTSYPKVNGIHVDSSKMFIQDILRDQWKFDGLVMSDWGATTSTKDSINAGLDLEMPGPAKWRSLDAVKAAVDAGSVTSKTIAGRARAVLQLLHRTGKFSDRKEAVSETAIDKPEHRSLIREAGAEGLVLLKNTDSILPLDMRNCKKLAILGPLAKYAAAHGGGSASLNCHYKVTPFDAFTARLGAETEILHSKGAHIYRVYPELEAGCTNKEGKPGFTTEYFANEELEGKPFYSQGFPRGYFMTMMDDKASGKKSVRLTTSFVPDTSGNHYLSYSSMGTSKMYINDTVISEQKQSTKDSMAFLLGTQEENRFRYSFTKGQVYKIHVDAWVPAELNGELYLFDGHIAVHLGFVSQEEMERDVLTEAVDLAKKADYAILFVGNTTQWETEGQDMEDMNLPADGSQDRLITEVAKVNSNTIVVNTTGVAVSVPWLDEVSALVQAWYSGQETGNAILDVLFGKVNPSGKLPISWPRKYEDTAVCGNFGLDSYESREVEYVEGVYVGYRHFDKHFATERQVLFPFGYGLSYSTFSILEVSLEGRISNDTSDGVTISVNVENTGNLAGAETIQAYLAPPTINTIDRPLKGLVGFSKVFLSKGEKKSTTISFQKDSAAFWDVVKHKWVIERGTYKILVGTSSDPKDLKTSLKVDVPQTFSYEP
ncbi:(Trans)glycosidase [Glarea lozoyensis ATCC 20868]|uniref:beta-glucosidase n=1 Tax=Glarea lozoyensis (strain ATCC 20868 / MF5171) TaxID=1116229 RepID=S3DIM6_GLAL2|nr:(Trans)glycosidase [Glarea lozoyensis ATCC 20868]EPE37019.1 (Trans)glycosidase [Glarea lozoyensis ATCC 20868]